jgi:2'-5' RNA ligase
MDTNMTKIAIDVALLPSKEVMDLAIEFNKHLGKKSINTIMLNKTNCFPHISLCMGVIDSKDLKKISIIINRLITDFSNISLTIDSFKIYPMKNGDQLYSFNIEPSKKISDLQRKIMIELWSFLSYEVRPQMLYLPKEINDTTLLWIKNYANKHDSPKEFHPHITIGFGQTDKKIKLIKFKPSQIGIFQLGNNCTCRKRLYSLNLK